MLVEAVFVIRSPRFFCFFCSFITKPQIFSVIYKYFNHLSGLCFLKDKKNCFILARKRIRFEFRLFISQRIASNDSWKLLRWLLRETPEQLNGDSWSKSAKAFSNEIILLSELWKELKVAGRDLLAVLNKIWIERCDSFIHFHGFSNVNNTDKSSEEINSLFQ